MRYFACALLVVGCSNSQVRSPQSLPPGGQVTVATYNLYIGAEFNNLLSQQSNPGPAVAGVFQAVQATDPAARMDAVAGLLAKQPPDLVGLVECALWRTQTPADGTATPATNVAYDFLQLILDGLSRRGLSYTAAVVGTNTDIEATGDFSNGPMDVRFTDRDVILVKSGVAPGATSQNHYETELQVPTSTVLGTVHVVRGWVAVDVLGFRFLETHLEAAANPIRDAQAAQLLVDTANTAPIVMAGDFNFSPSDSVPYGSLQAAQFEEQWPKFAPNDPGDTCCQDDDLKNADSKLDTRIDLVWTRGGDFRATAADLMGNTPADKTPSGLWPSDHAGVRMTLQKP